jgi:hypothetical protein
MLILFSGGKIHHAPKGSHPEAAKIKIKKIP